MTGKQAETVLGGPVHVSPSLNPNPGKQGSCLYGSASSLPGTLLVNVSWDQRSVANFAGIHGGHATVVPGTTGTGVTIPPAPYTKVSVDGSAAYWLPHPPTPAGRDFAANATSLSATKHRYVVTLNSMGLDQLQNERALGLILNRL
jgi:hypothetical protein